MIDYDIVVFPQHGLLKNPQTVLLMREALKNGGTMVGGLDPAGIDYAIEESLETIFDLAEEFQVGIDIHLHDTGKWVFIQLINF